MIFFFVFWKKVGNDSKPTKILKNIEDPNANPVLYPPIFFMNIVGAENKK